MKKIINYIVQNLIIILSGIIIVFIILDEKNPTMNFINNKTIILIFILCLISIINAIIKLIKSKEQEV